VLVVVLKQNFAGIVDCTQHDLPPEQRAADESTELKLDDPQGYLRLKYLPHLPGTPLGLRSSQLSTNLYPRWGLKRKRVLLILLQ